MLVKIISLPTTKVIPPFATNFEIKYYSFEPKQNLAILFKSCFDCAWQVMVKMPMLVLGPNTYFEMLKAQQETKTYLR